MRKEPCLQWPLDLDTNPLEHSTCSSAQWVSDLPAHPQGQFLKISNPLHRWKGTYTDVCMYATESSVCPSVHLWALPLGSAPLENVAVQAVSF